MDRLTLHPQWLVSADSHAIHRIKVKFKSIMRYQPFHHDMTMFEYRLKLTEGVAIGRICRPSFMICDEKHGGVMKIFWIARTLQVVFGWLLRDRVDFKRVCRSTNEGCLYFQWNMVVKGLGLMVIKISSDVRFESRSIQKC